MGARGQDVAQPGVILDSNTVNNLARMLRSAISQAQSGWGHESMPSLSSLSLAEAGGIAGNEESALPIPAPRLHFDPYDRGTEQNGNPGNRIDGLPHPTPAPKLRGSGPSMKRADGAFDDIIQEAASTYGLNKNLISAVIQAESSFNPKAVSPAGAQGLMQLMPATGRSLGVDDPFNPRQNIMAGSRYLRRLLDRYQGNTQLALAAYNWGPGNLERSLERQTGKMPQETRQYVAKISGMLEQSRAVA
ncbi:MAG: lytic transglycosylase domain-containing protein [Magnetococcales bacterium]|nr:lytic transglycosylase domain-containing protein [Magnetococcales bacterium]